MKQKNFKTDLTTYAAIALFLLLNACTAPIQQFHRTGSPADFNNGTNSSQFKADCPSVSVSIANVGKNPFLQNDGSLMGAIVSGSVKKSDKNRNDEYLRLLQNSDIQKYTQETTTQFINSVISDSNILSINKKCELSCPEKSTKINEIDTEAWKKCPKSNENLFSMGSRLLYYATEQGDVMDMVIYLEYLDSSIPRKVIYSEKYVSIEITDMFNNVDAIRDSSKKLVDISFGKLSPWIKTDLLKRDNWYGAYQLVDIEFKNGNKRTGYKLEETDSHLTFRYIDGGLEIIPKKFVESIKNSPSVRS